MRACSVVRNPPRASSTASAVPNDPAPITVARFAPGVGSDRARGPRAPGLGFGLELGLGLAATPGPTGAPGLACAIPPSDALGVAVGSGSII